MSRFLFELVWCKDGGEVISKLEELENKCGMPVCCRVVDQSLITGDRKYWFEPYKPKKQWLMIMDFS